MRCRSRPRPCLDRSGVQAGWLRARTAHVITIARQMPQSTFRHLTPSRVAGAEEYDSRLHATASRVNQCLVRLQIPQTDNINGTSTSMPSTVANAAPNSVPNRAMAVAVTNSKKLLAPINAPGAGSHGAHETDA